jgi:hypothetical protein
VIVLLPAQGAPLCRAVLVLEWITLKQPLSSAYESAVEECDLREWDLGTQRPGRSRDCRYVSTKCYTSLYDKYFPTGISQLGQTSRTGWNLPHITSSPSAGHHQLLSWGGCPNPVLQHCITISKLVLRLSAMRSFRCPQSLQFSCTQEVRQQVQLQVGTN